MEFDVGRAISLIETLLMPDTGNVVKPVQHVATVVEPNFSHDGDDACERQLLRAQLVV